VIRIFHIADLHIDERSRFGECQRVLNEFVDHVERKKPNLVLCAGDVFTRRSTPREMSFSEQIFQRIANTCAVVLVRGNHDAEFEIENFQRLRALYPIYGVEEPRVITETGIAIACLPWPSKAGVVMHSKELDLETADQEATSHLQAILRWLSDEIQDIAQPAVLLAHAMVRGSKFHEESQPKTGCDFELGLEDLCLECGVEAVMLGHIHIHQSWRLPCTVGECVYAGSPYHSDFGDLGAKGYVEWTIEQGQRPTWKHVPLSATPMYHCTGRWNSSYSSMLLTKSEDYQYPCEIKLTYEVSAEHCTEARHWASQWKADMIARGAINVVPEPKIQVSTRARAPEVATASTTANKLRAYWSSLTSGAPDDRQAQRLIDKLTEIEEV